MKKALILLLAIVCLNALFAPGCKNTPPTAPPVVTDTLESWHCAPIAPLPELKRAVGMRGKFHPVGSTIKIGFIGGTEAQKTLIRNGFASWKQSANLNFEYPATGPYNIRVSFSGGSAWSYIGIDCNQISQNSPTLNVGFGLGAAEQAAGRSAVVEHEIGHALGLLHEQSIAGAICYNEANVIADLSGSPNFWSEAQIRFNVLTPHNPANVIIGVYDSRSIMHYAIKASWTCNNVAIPGGNAITAGDRAFMSERYPGVVMPPVGTVTITKVQRDNIWRLQQKAKLYTDSVHLITKTVFGL